jgi:hypothetical protein
MSQEGERSSFTRAEIASRLAEEGKIIPELVLGRLGVENADEKFTPEAVMDTVADEGAIIQRVVAEHLGLREEGK